MSLNIKRLLWLPVVLLVLYVCWVAIKVLSYEQLDNPLHLAEKQRYLEQLANVATPSSEVARPNIVFILFDDLGYGDLGATGSEIIATPAIDALAEQGLSLTQFYAPAPVCTPSRAGFLTGRLPLRAGLPSVVFPEGSPMNIPHRFSGTNIHLPREEITLAEVLQASGYQTGMVGKWHLGDKSNTRPNDFGFDYFFGALYSNGMKPFSLYRNRDIAFAAPADQTQLKARYSREAVEFIGRQEDGPFFLYFPHNFPHIPLYIPEEDRARSKGGLYGDVVEGLDETVANVVAALKAKGVYDNTLILISSDNGPWYQGSRGNSRGRKGDTFEGGMHVPMIVHWPQGLEGGRSIDGISMGTDWLPTILDWLQLPAPKDRTLDGRSLRSMLEVGGESPHDYLYYLSGTTLAAVRDPDYKYHDRRPIIYAAGNLPGALGAPKGPWLFDSRRDFNESYDISMNEPAAAARMKNALEAKRQELQDNPRGWIE